ncbi:aspartyl protease [Pseudomonas sp. BAY1663]|nr:aspartyl protease [Pseudomonas sp. BAY1663]
MRSIEILFAGLLSLSPAIVQAASMVQVVGLFPGAAVLNVDGQRKLVRAGQTGPGGVEVISADASGALLRVDGIERRYDLSREYSGAYAAPIKTQLSVAKGTEGTTGSPAPSMASRCSFSSIPAPPRWRSTRTRRGGWASTIASAAGRWW